jgi:diguanylate cyclase
VGLQTIWRIAPARCVNRTTTCRQEAEFGVCRSGYGDFNEARGARNYRSTSRRRSIHNLSLRGYTPFAASQRFHIGTGRPASATRSIEASTRIGRARRLLQELRPVSASYIMLIALALMQFGVGLFVGVWWSRRAATAAVSPKIARLAAKLHSLTEAVTDEMGLFRRGMECSKQQLLEIQAEAANDAGTQELANAIVGIIAEVIERQSRLQGKLAEAETTLQEQASQIESYLSEARTDSLTNLPNRRALDEELARRYAQWERRRGSLSFMLLDVDHFKQLNDKFGHPAGDAVLRKLADVLKKTSRTMDMVARYGGEEFGMVLPDSDLNAGKAAAERVRTAVQDCEFMHHGQPLSVTVSVGVGELMVGEDHASMVDRTDTALYAAKRGGRNRSYFHDGRKCHPVLADKPPASDEDVELEIGLVLEEEPAILPPDLSPELAGACSDLRQQARKVAVDKISRPERDR